MIIASEKILDGLAWLIGAVALCAGLLCASGVGIFISAWLYQGRSFRSLVWTLADPTFMGGMAKVLAVTAGLGLSTIALARRGHRELSPVSMASFALRLGHASLAVVGLAAALTGLILACRLAILMGLW